MTVKRLLIILFFITAAIYSLALYQSIRAYEEWKKAKLEEYPAEIRPYVDFDPYRSSKQGQQFIVLGAVLCFGWLTLYILYQPSHKTSAHNS